MSFDHDIYNVACFDVSAFRLKRFTCSEAGSLSTYSYQCTRMFVCDTHNVVLPFLVLIFDYLRLWFCCAIWISRLSERDLIILFGILMKVALDTYICM